MIRKLTKKLKSQKGAMDKILVTLLLVIVGVASLVTLEQWFSTKRNDLITSSNNAINVAKSESGSY